MTTLSPNKAKLSHNDINDLNTPIIRDWQNGLKKNYVPTICCLR